MPTAGTSKQQSQQRTVTAIVVVANSALDESESATTGRAGGMRKAPKRGRGVRFHVATVYPCRRTSHRPAIGMFGFPRRHVSKSSLPQPDKTSNWYTWPDESLLHVRLQTITTRGQPSPSSRRKRQSLCGSHRQSRWINFDLVFSDFFPVGRNKIPSRSYYIFRGNQNNGGERRRSGLTSWGQRKERNFLTHRRELSWKTARQLA